MDNRFQVKLIAPIRILFQEQKKIVITTHQRPDGDAIGSSLGLYNYLMQKNHRVDVVVPSDYPEFLKWMPGNQEIINYETDPVKAGAPVCRPCHVRVTLEWRANRVVVSSADGIIDSSAARAALRPDAGGPDGATGSGSCPP